MYQGDMYQGDKQLTIQVSTNEDNDDDVSAWADSAAANDDNDDDNCFAAFTLFLGARDFNVDCLFSHRLRVNFFTEAGQCTRHGIDLIVPVNLS